MIAVRPLPPSKLIAPISVLVPMVDLSSQVAALQHSTLHISTGGGAQSVTYNQESPDEEETETSVAFSTLRVGLVLHRGDEGVAARVNDLNAYLDANRRVRICRQSRSEVHDTNVDRLSRRLIILIRRRPTPTDDRLSTARLKSRPTA
jgi:hypothetical protein